MSRKRIDTQVEIAEIAGRRYGVQVTTGNPSGMEIFLTWKNASKLLKDLRSLDALDGLAEAIDRRFEQGR